MPAAIAARFVELLPRLWYQFRLMIDRTHSYFWYYAFPKPLADEGSRSV
jgi:hypothetical protein